jgi:YVTN family beta-propeller protein
VAKPDGTRLYTENDNDKRLYVIDGATNSILTTVTLPAAVLDMAITSDGKRLYATTANSVLVIDTATNALTNTISTGSNTGPITVSPGRAGVLTPDLLITTLTTNGSTAEAGNTLSVTDAVKNQGQASSDDIFTIAYRLSRTANYDDPNAASVAAIRAVGALAVGASDQITTSLLVPLVNPGAYFVCAKADPPDDILESDETNNTLCSTSTVQINIPDLVMTLEFPKSSTVPAGQVLVVTDTVRNQGGASTGVSFTIGYRLSPTVNYDDPNSKVLATIRAVGALAAGASETADRGLLIPTTVAPGTYFVCAKADVAEGISENNEDNNALCSASTVNVQ